MSDKQDHPSACLSVSLSDEHQIIYYQAQVRQPYALKLNPVLVITNTGFRFPSDKGGAEARYLVGRVGRVGQVGRRKRRKTILQNGLK